MSSIYSGTERPKLSVIVPFFNEEDSIVPMYGAITAAVEPLKVPFEVVFVDDGSLDATYLRAVELARSDARVRVIKFRRNYGQTAAMAAGIEHARGEILVTMDGDLQNDPADVQRLMEKMGEGFDIVVGWRHQRQDKFLTRKLPSKIANRLIGFVTGVPITDNGCSLKAYRADLIKKIPLYSEMHRFIPAMAWMAGPRIAEIKVRHHARKFGRSKYGLSRIYKVLIDLLVIKTLSSFTSRPLVWFGLLSLPLWLLGTATLLASIMTIARSNATSIVPLAGSGLILLSSAVFMLASGLFGELIYRTGNSREHDFAGITARLSRTRAQ